MTREDPIVIVSAVRTPMGGFLGDFKDVNAATLGAAAVRLFAQSGLSFFVSSSF
ncbi:hypothetical protein DZ933_019515, partial [Pseudomonas aeruginosa]|nr:hypothetical protein [Pseudomonas aeruginosa]